MSSLGPWHQNCYLFQVQSIVQYRFLYRCVQDYIKELMADEDDGKNKDEETFLIQRNAPTVKFMFWYDKVHFGVFDSNIVPPIYGFSLVTMLFFIGVLWWNSKKKGKRYAATCVRCIWAFCWYNQSLKNIAYKHFRNIMIKILKNIKYQ